MSDDAEMLLQVAAGQTIRAGDPVALDTNGKVVRAGPGQLVVEVTREATADDRVRVREQLTQAMLAEARLQMAEAVYLALVEPVRRSNAEARERWRERVLERLYGLAGSTSERPCAACDEPGPWFVCLLCSTGMPRNGTWRITPGAAERIRAKMYARRYDEPLPLPGGER